MASEIRMPELGSDMTEADLVQWLVAVGDTIEAGELIAEIETDKATVEFESPLSGVVVELCVAAPATGVKVGELIARIEESDAVASSATRPAGPAPERSAAATPPPAAPPPPRVEIETARAVAVPATALARRIAEQEGVDLRGVEPSGAGGRVTKADVEAAAGTSPAARRGLAEIERTDIASEPVDSAGPQGAPLSRMRRTIARRMSEAKRNVPHFYLEIRCDAKQLLAVRAKLNAGLDGPGLSVNDFCVAAAARALRDVPDANVAWRGDSIERFATSDIAVAVATDDGLITPVLRNAASLGLIEVSARLRELIARARAGRLSPFEFEGGLALSNLGMYGITAVWPIVNPPHACILGIGAVEEVPVVEGDAVVPGTRMTCTLSADHRAVDGAIGARLLSTFRRYVEDPLEMIL
jgi:pyruvate dehydrogenase E2 component (dihydrolipoamide acetyltransferase)